MEHGNSDPWICNVVCDSDPWICNLACDTDCDHCFTFLPIHRVQLKGTTLATAKTLQVQEQLDS
jgi:hypothetical protein